MVRRSESADVVGGKYRLISELGSGGMGTVWRAHHLSLRCPIALKLLNPAIATDPHAVERFLREARTAAALRSLHVVQILDYGMDGETPYIAMEMLDGESLAERLERDNRLSLSETARVIRHVSRALGRAHDAGVVHRDLKPENIFIVTNDDDAVIKVLDFGIAKTTTTRFDTSKPALKTRTGSLMGTPYFMSPEQADGAMAVDFRADLWALGVIAFECLLGQLPFTGGSLARITLAICSDPLPVPSEVGPVPVGFDAWFARACARAPAARFNSAKDAAEAFDELERRAGPASASQPLRQSPSDLEAAEPARDVQASQHSLPVRMLAARRRTLLEAASLALLGVALAGAALRLARGGFQVAPSAVPGQVQHELAPAHRQRPDPEPTRDPIQGVPALDASTAINESPTSQQPLVKDSVDSPRVDARAQPNASQRRTMSALKRKKLVRPRSPVAEPPLAPSSKVPTVDDLGI